MSGGHFEHIDSRLKSEIFGWCNGHTNVFEDREISELVWDVLDLIHDFDWYASGDTGEAAWLEAKNTFKKKWFSNNRGLRVRRIIDEALQETKEELYKTFNLQEE